MIIFGAVLNSKKSSWTSTKLPSRRSLVHLGVDVLLRCTPWCEPRVRMKQRVRAVGVRSELIRVLPPSQRGILVAEAVASLWIAGGTSFWCSSAQTHVIEVGWSIERFGRQAIWQACSRCGTPFWSRCAQNVPACSIHLHFLFAVYTHGVHGKIGYLSNCDFVGASCAVSGMRARNGGCLPCDCRRLVRKVISVCHSKLENSSMPRVKGQVGCRICDLFCALLSLVS